MNKWIKIIGGTMAVGLLATVITGAVLAQGPDGDSDGIPNFDGPGVWMGRGHGWGFMDEDGDGVNDRYPSGPRFVDEDGDDICDLHEDHFVDEDGDGICDLHGEAPGEGYGYSAHPMGRGMGHWADQDFVDEDGDGVCDLMGESFVDEDGDGICDLHNGTPGEGRGYNAHPMGRGMGRWAAAQ